MVTARAIRGVATASQACQTSGMIAGPSGHWRQQHALQALRSSYLFSAQPVSSHPIRFQSSVTAPPSPSASTPSDPLTTLLIPPPSTRPPPFSAVERSPTDSTFTYYRSLGKTYLTFYKTAIKHIWRTRQAARIVRGRDRTLASDSILSAREFTKRFEALRLGAKGQQREDGLEAQKPAISRAEWQVLIRARENLKCVPPFILLFAVFGEWTPLIAPFVLRIIPYPAKTPSMVERERIGLETRRKEMLRSGIAGRVVSVGVEEWKARKSGVMKGSGDQARVVVGKLSSDELYALSTTLDISTRSWSYWERLPFVPILRWRVERALQRLAIDDTLFLKGEEEVVQKQSDRGHKSDQALAKRVRTLEKMDSEEVHIMAVARGVDVVGRKLSAVAKDVATWFEGRSQGRCMEELLLSRPLDDPSRPPGLDKRQ